VETEDTARGPRKASTSTGQTIRPIRLRNLDLRLLLILDAVLVEGSVTQAARRLGMSQPAVSTALSRLRHILKDDLFTREPGGMRPTPRALDLAVPINQALRQLEAAVQPMEFVPAESTRRFRMAIASHTEMAILPQLVERIHKVAPFLELHAMPKPNPEVARQLDANQIDFAIGAVGKIPDRFQRAFLYDDEFVCVMRSGHPLAKKKTLTLAEFAAARHLLVTSTGESSTLLDAVLGKHHQRRSIQITVKHFLAGAQILEETDLVAGWFFRSLGPVLHFAGKGLTIRRLPLPPIRVEIVWHPGLTAHPAYKWLRNEISAVCEPFRSGKG
jgi:molybdate transport repressor ModE-like protein